MMKSFVRRTWPFAKASDEDADSGEEACRDTAAAASDGPRPGEPVATGTLVEQTEADLQVPLSALENKRIELAEAMVQCLPDAFNGEMLLLNPEDIQVYATNMQAAPIVMRLRYNTRENYTWATAGFRVLSMSYYPNNQKTPESKALITGRCLALTLIGSQ